ncbi:uncharacterized protein HaLaN_05595 [Haematococcus lacustris]|uniref:CDP-diacylglycerol--glycerol-3-phosphate 3-phosphatidyltransferase n=1 Tax=Haematococcus lacustris TaxID=44745 RepID=A0A699YTM0_HAELA|nr:uncharacterized protein HaLaN_05595 [Haematococcus lacustris]
MFLFEDVTVDNFCRARIAGRGVDVARQPMAPAQLDNAEIPRIPLLLRGEGAESILSPLDRRSETYRHLAAAHRSPQPPVRQPILTLPNVLTFVRLVMVPVTLVLWELQWQFAPITAAIVFIAAALTDWLDGYLARRLKLATVFGAFLDPVADKIMVCTTLILLTTSPPAPVTPSAMVVPVALMICRELTMSALREWAAASGGAAHKAVKVNSLGKWKTALQMVSMSTLLVLRQPAADLARWLPGCMSGPPVLRGLTWAAFALLWGATALALWSLAIYMSNPGMKSE